MAIVNILHEGDLLPARVAQLHLLIYMRNSLICNYVHQNSILRQKKNMLYSNKIVTPKIYILLSAREVGLIACAVGGQLFSSAKDHLQKMPNRLGDFLAFYLRLIGLMDEVRPVLGCLLKRRLIWQFQMQQESQFVILFDFTHPMKAKVTSQELKQRKAICIIESIGGSDKGPDGHRKDTIPIREEILKRGWYCEIIKFEIEKADQFYEYVVNKFSGYIGRVNPGSFPDNEKCLFETLIKLSEAGLVGMTRPDSMIKFGAKSALVELSHTGLVPKDTYSYLDVETFKRNFPETLTHGERVLKQNRGSAGEGIWRVSVEDKRPYKAGDILPADTKIKCTEAVDNHVEHRELGEFMEFCEKYIIGDQGMLVDMKFLPRIKEGELRVLMVGSKPMFVVHKKPAAGEDAFSATLFSGAVYTYDKPEKWQKLVDFFLAELPGIKKTLHQTKFPLIWTADFILDWNEQKEDAYILGEINCSCVGFTSQLDMGIQDAVAAQAIKQTLYELDLNEKASHAE